MTIPVRCPRCYRGIDDDGDGNCRFCHNRSDMDCAFSRWWHDLTMQGDPSRIPNMAATAFKAGWNAREAKP